jgi:hypothetical protein
VTSGSRGEVPRVKGTCDRSWWWWWWWWVVVVVVMMMMMMMMMIMSHFGKE